MERRRGCDGRARDGEREGRRETREKDIVGGKREASLERGGRRAGERDEGKEASTTFRGPHTDRSSRMYGRRERGRETRRKRERGREIVDRAENRLLVVFGKTRSGKLAVTLGRFDRVTRANIFVTLISSFFFSFLLLFSSFLSFHATLSSKRR